MTYCKKSNQASYPFVLPDLPFSKDSFLPHFTVETFDYHHGKHHQGYVTNLNNLLQDNKTFANNNLEEIIIKSYNSNPAIFNNAGQIWNHTFFWNSIKPNGGGKPNQGLLDQINKGFASFENFIAEFKQTAISQFGSGWAWLVFHDGKLQIMRTSNAETPIIKGMYPLLACDVWEHAYYIDYRNRRPDYVTTYIDHMINWEFAEQRLNNIAK